MSKVRILSIDGGGIRGILPGTILRYIEEQLQKKENNNKKIAEYFDLIAGTSTGGILACAYLTPDDNDNTKPKFSAKEAVDIYLDRGDEIFDVPLLEKIKRGGGILDEKYPAEELEEALDDYFGEKELKDLVKPCLVTAYDIRNRKAVFFTSADAEGEIRNFKIKDIARATGAAPTYFEPARIKSVFGTPYPLIDGGVFANNPTMCAYAEARTTLFSQIASTASKPDNPTASQMMIVSIGTGCVNKPYYFKEMKDAGMISWIRPIIDIMMSGNSETVNYQLRQIYDTLKKPHNQDYYRLEPDLINASPEMDDASKENLMALEEDGLAFIEKNKEKLDEIVGKLIENK